jgi:glycosyltransferase involved in cell wall biosynthesis
MPEVTAVIPTRNRWPLLSAAITGVLRQEDVDVEVVVVDDGSNDETPSRLAGLDDPRVRFFRHEQSQGQAVARNRGLASAQGGWVAFHDDDDLWSPRKLRTQLDVASAKDATFAYGAAVVFEEGTGIVTPDAGVPDPAELPTRMLEGNALPGGCSNVLVRTELVRKLGGFDERLSVLSDWDMWLRVANAGPGAASSEVLVAYRRHARNLHVRDVDHMLREVEYFAGKHRPLGMRFDPVGYSRWLASETTSRTDAARVYLRAGLAFRSLGNITRAVGVVLGARQRRRTREPPIPAPDWLHLDQQASSP